MNNNAEKKEITNEQDKNVKNIDEKIDNAYSGCIFPVIGAFFLALIVFIFIMKSIADGFLSGGR